MSRPTTATGKQFAKEVAFVSDEIGFRLPEANERVAAIEIDAIEQERIRLVEEIEKLPTGWMTNYPPHPYPWVYKSSVLALLQEPAKTVDPGRIKTLEVNEGER